MIKFASISIELFLPFFLPCIEKKILEVTGLHFLLILFNALDKLILSIILHISCGKSIAAPGSICSISFIMLCMLHCTASAFLPACYVKILHAAFPIFAWLGFAEMCR